MLAALLTGFGVEVDSVAAMALEVDSAQVAEQVQVEVVGDPYLETSPSSATMDAPPAEAVPPAFRPEGQDDEAWKPCEEEGDVDKAAEPGDRRIAFIASSNAKSTFSPLSTKLYA